VPDRKRARKVEDTLTGKFGGMNLGDCRGQHTVLDQPALRDLVRVATQFERAYHATLGMVAAKATHLGHMARLIRHGFLA
jgi:hypothetical protein